ncbi:hypothetical protein SKAU_G00204450 [Synaphobranchus kaupii]|uniref:Uncharacterized protein n=1 Tax=Synaphobranchus kaupii TaxID=118154 RepID=A0A9Q1FG89_SYNKA|nr:hypothetical protein SKAU_G00204450 [Synaphobranchus kaupii]
MTAVLADAGSPVTTEADCSDIPACSAENAGRCPKGPARDSKAPLGAPPRLKTLRPSPIGATGGSETTGAEEEDDGEGRRPKTAADLTSKPDVKRTGRVSLRTLFPLTRSALEQETPDRDLRFWDEAKKRSVYIHIP